MLKINNDCMDSADWVENVCGYRPMNNIITLQELNKISEDKTKNGGCNGIMNYWDYPLSEINHLIENAYDMDEDYVIQLVKFLDENNNEIYRFCEI